MSEVRLLPLVIGAAGAMLALKAFVLMVDGGKLAAVTPALAQEQVVERGNEPAGGALFGADQSRSREDILQSLTERREALEARERELDLREKLIEATRARMEDRIAELRQLEASIEARVAARREEDNQRFAGLVSMYESMKPRDAAKIFDRLELSVLTRVAAQMNARTMAEILAAMDPDVAKRLTVELSSEPRDPLEPGEGEELPKIMGSRADG